MDPVGAMNRRGLFGGRLAVRPPQDAGRVVEVERLAAPRRSRGIGVGSSMPAAANVVAWAAPPVLVGAAGRRSVRPRAVVQAAGTAPFSPRRS